MTDTTVHQLKKQKRDDYIKEEISKKERHCFEVANSEAEFYLGHAIRLIDEQLGDGYAADHPGFLGDVMIWSNAVPYGSEAYFGDIIEMIDEQTGEGYAAKHPELISSFLDVGADA